MVKRTGSLACVVFVLAIGCKGRGGEGGDQPEPTAPRPTTAPPPATAKEPVAPSTGKEMPKTVVKQLRRDEAQKVVASVMVDVAAIKAKGEKPDCTKVTQALLRALPVVSPHVSKETLEPYLVLARCADKAKYWQTLLRVSSELLELGGEAARPGLYVRALMGLGRHDEARGRMKELIKKYPQDSNLIVVGAKLLCEVENFEGCLKASVVAAKVAENDPNPQRREESVSLALVTTWEASVFLGDYEQAEKATEVLARRVPKLSLDRFRKIVATAQLHDFHVDPQLNTEIALGLYHLYSASPKASAGAPVHLKLFNHSKANRQVKIEASIAGVTESTTRTVMMLAGKREDVHLVPPLKADFRVAEVRSERPAQLDIKVIEDAKGGPVSLYEQSIPVTLLPRDRLPLTRVIGHDGKRYTLENIGAWITPNAPAVDKFLAAAKRRTQGATFAGEQQPTIPQVKALFDELKARGVTYVMDPIVTSEAGLVQRTRLPTEVLESTNAQCLEGTILFATLMEAIGLRPIIVIVPGHAFVGWHPTTKDGVTATTTMFVETTMVGNAPFEAAMKTATNRVKEEARLAHFKAGLSFLVELTDLRKQGITPQPTL